MSIVKAWKDTVVIPTYEVGKPEKYPVFLEKRVYQASSGVVYPHPVIEKISDEKVDKEWDVIYLENDFIKIMVIPSLGGRIQMAYDKIRERHFVYYNNVIKPALVGLTGPWISGGIEFNWPQHHRPSTYDPTDFHIEENKDGSITVWVSEVERMFRTKGMAGFTLYPDKAYLEIKGQLYNRTSVAQTFLWWANPAVAVNDHYQSVFPPDVNAVFDHGKRDVSEFPIAKGEYYKVDYSPGTDISRYKNIPVPTSYMAITSDYDFVGGYENDSKGGLLHVADHHISPGKKQWTWGNGDFGKAWDRNLTDNDGPYIELMCGVYTDNQPDFSWMHPYEEKSFKQYFMPYYNVGIVKNATKEALLNLEMEEEQVRLKIHVTSHYPKSVISLYSENKILFESVRNLDPANGFEELIAVNGISYKSLTAKVKDANGKILVSWSPASLSDSEIPEAAKAAKQPNEINSVEQLFLRGLHLEQYRHATYDPTAYYLEGLSRDPKDVRCNNAMGLWYLKRAKFEEALKYFEAAIDTLIERNPNPYDGEPYFNKGLTLSYLGNKKEAYAAFYKSCWNAAWQDAGYFNCAQIECANDNLEKALELVDKSLIKNWHNHKARHLKVIILRKLGHVDEAKQLIHDSLAIDAFNFGVIYERYQITGASEDLENLLDITRANQQNFIEFSIDYAQAGQYNEAIALLNILVDKNLANYPMVYYFLGAYHLENSEYDKANENFKLGSKMPMDYCFPNRLEEVVVLQAAIRSNSQDAKTNYYLGNFWYASKQYEEARLCWEKAIEYDNSNAICYRNLALLNFNKKNDHQVARIYLEKAFELDNTDARLLMELDQFYKKCNVSVNERLILLEKNIDLVQSRDDLYLEYLSLHTFRGEYENALELISQRQFHPWEGGEGKVPFQYVTVNVELAKKNIKQENYNKAIEYLLAAQAYPENLGEGKLYGTQENDIFYWLGCAYEGINEVDKAKECWEFAATGISEPSPAMFYNDQQPDKIFYQGLALLKLKRKEEANYRFTKLIAYGEDHMEDDVKLDYFAISLPDLLIWEEDLIERNKINCSYLMALGNLGLQQYEVSSKMFDCVMSSDHYNMQAFIHREMVADIINQSVKI